MPSAPVSRLSRRAFVLAGVAAPLLAGCTSDPNSDSAEITSLLRQSFDRFTGGGSVSRAQAAQVPFASIGVRIGGSSQDLFVLATQTRDDCLWASAAHLAIETQSGRVTRTSGFEHNSAQTPASGSDPLQARMTLPGRCSYEMELADRGVYRAPVRYEMSRVGPERIEVLGAELDVVHHIERGACALLNWEFQNDYWVSPDGTFLWSSSQYIHPDLDALKIVVFRPPV